MWAACCPSSVFEVSWFQNEVPTVAAMTTPLLPLAVATTVQLCSLIRVRFP